MSERRRWRSPPMNRGPEGAEDSQSQVRLDEKVVRTMLKVNPDMRAGRTTFQVKRDLERGSAVTGPAESSQPSQPPGGPGPLSRPTDSAPQAPARRTELAETVGYFVRGKADALEATLAEIAERRRALDEEEASARRDVVDQLVRFVALLDETQVALHGVTVLSGHAGLLARLGVTPAEILEAARRARAQRT